MNIRDADLPISAPVKAFLAGAPRIECTGLAGAERSYLIRRIGDGRKTPLVVVLPTLKEAEQCMEELSFFLQDRNRPVSIFPPYNILPYKHLAYHSETAATRISTLYRLATNDGSPIVVTTAGALMKHVIPKDELLGFAELVMVGEELDRNQLIEKLVGGGYFHSTIVEEQGDFSVRGGIIDIFSPLYDMPFRIEFFGDVPDTIRFFDPVSQRRIEDVSEVTILPAKEAILNFEKINPMISRLRALGAELDIPVTETRKMVERIRTERSFSGLESLMSIIYECPNRFFDFVPQGAAFCLIEPGQLEKSATDFLTLIDNHFQTAIANRQFCSVPQSDYLPWAEVLDAVATRQMLVIKSLPVSRGYENPDASPLSFHFRVEDNGLLIDELKQHRNRERLLAPLIQWISDQHHNGRRTFVVCRTQTQIQRMKSLLDNYHVRSEIADQFNEPPPQSGLPVLNICSGSLDEGFVWPEALLAVVTAKEIFGTIPKPAKRSRLKSRLPQLDVSDLKKGDVVVHVDHGIGEYQGLIKLNIEGVINDFLLIVYKENDKLYLPMERMNVIQKYMGVGDAKPVLDKLGGKSWERIKAKVKKSAEKIAGELLKLYASRQVQQGYAFSMPDEDFRAFEASFPYDETKDQNRAIQDVLQDMGSTTPMDRLVCGDVGYGKTEVALRAAFKAVNDCKQVAVVVPTTVLAEQHFQTFSERFDRYPVKVACLTRFRSTKIQKEIIAELKNGTMDIVIGTHRLFQKDVAFKDLGLLILDEEHRFGVRHKESLKQFKQAVDVLALTATPIPRTLHLSLTGIRDISAITTPPEHRRAIITYISELDEAIIADAVRKELGRKGQIFFIHNNISSIHHMANRLQGLIPEVKLGVAHGRMKEEELEQVMLKFLNKDIDMLVCTTIVESGLDIPSANTILINRADRFGLAQIYQLRGRVGRADEQAFAYLFIPPESHLSKDAQKRLKVLMEHSDLGSGFQIALSDLKIRGGGTILGAAQSGHIAAVGFDMYLKLMESAIAELKGQKTTVPLNPEINFSLSAYLPEYYIPDIDQRLSAYRRLSRMESLSEIKEFKAEIRDRYGTLPAEAVNLLMKMMLKVMSKHAGVKKLDVTEKKITLQFSKIHMQTPERLLELVNKNKRTHRLAPGDLLSIDTPKHQRRRSLSFAKNILKEITQHVNA